MAMRKNKNIRSRIGYLKTKNKRVMNKTNKENTLFYSKQGSTTGDVTLEKVIKARREKVARRKNTMKFKEKNEVVEEFEL